MSRCCSNGCGVCCLLAPCPVGIVLSRRWRGSCAALRWVGAERRYRCGALLAAIEAQFASAAVFELFTGSRSEANIRLYRRHGYAITATKQLSDQVSIVVMRKPANGTVS